MHTRPLLPSYTPPGGREAPAPLVRHLRDVDDTAELLYAGAGVWCLGTYRPNRENERKAINMIKTLRSLQRAVVGKEFSVPRHVLRAMNFRLWRYDLYRQGFRMITRYTIQGEPQSWIHEDFRMRDWNFRERIDEIEAESLREADEDLQLERRLATLREYLEREAKGIHRHAFRQPKYIIPSTVTPRRRVG